MEHRFSKTVGAKWHKFDKDDKSTFPPDALEFGLFYYRGKQQFVVGRFVWLSFEDMKRLIAWRELPEPPKF